MTKEKTITELYKFLEENMATKREVGSLRKEMATKEDISDLQKEINELQIFLQGYVATKEDVRESERKLRKEIGVMKTELKEHTDEKLSDLQGNIVILMRKEDYKVLSLIKILSEKKILNDAEVKSLLKMEPFPKIT